MAINDTTEKRFEEDIESFLLSDKGGYTKSSDIYDLETGLYIDTFIGFIKSTQPREWARFEKICSGDAVRKFISVFNNACDTNGLLYVLRHGFKHRGISFRVCYFKPESHLNRSAATLYEKTFVAVTDSGIIQLQIKIPLIWFLQLTAYLLLLLNLKISTQVKMWKMQKVNG